MESESQTGQILDALIRVEPKEDPLKALQSGRKPSGPRVEGVRFVDCVLTGDQFRHARFENCSFQQSSFTEITMPGVRFDSCFFSNCTFLRADLRLAHFGNCRLIACRIVESRLVGATFLVTKLEDVEAEASDFHLVRYDDTCEMPPQLAKEMYSMQAFDEMADAMAREGDEPPAGG